MSQYVIAVKRGFRARVPGGLRPELERIEGISILGDFNPFRIRAEASDEAIERARQRLASYCHIEPLIPHFPQAASGWR